MGVDHGLVGGVRVERGLHEALCLVHLGPEGNHLRLHGVAQVSGLVRQRGVGLRGDERLQLLQLVHDALVHRLAAACELVEALELLQVLGTCWHVASLHHLDHGLNLATHAGDVVLVHHFLSCLGLLLGVDLQRLKELGVLLGAPGSHCLGRGVQVRQSSLACLNRPLCRVAVSGEDDVLVLGVELCHGIAMAHATLNQAGQVRHARRHDRIADHDGQAAILGGADGTELEAVAAEGERGRAIAVLDVGLDVHGSAAARRLLLLLGLVTQEIAAGADALDECLESLTGIQGDDGRRSLLCAQSVVVASARHGAAHHLVVLRQAVGQAGNGRHVQLRTSLVLARVEEVQAGVGADGPVGVLSAAVDAGKGLLVEEHLQTQLGGFPVHHLHEADVAVARHVGGTEDGGHLMLSRCHLVVLHSHWAPDLQHLSLDNVQQLLHAAGDRLEVVQVSLLMAGRQLAEQRAAGVHQVRPGLEVLGTEHEELLLPSQVAEHALCIGSDSNVLQEAQAVEGHRIHRSQERRLLIDAFSEVRDEGTRNVQASIHHEWRGRAVPGGEGGCGVGHSQASIREGGAIRLTLEEALRWQAGLHRLGDVLGTELQVHEGVFLEGSKHAADGATSATQGEEPVGEVDGTALASPCEHGVGDNLHVVLRGWGPADQALVEALHDGCRELRCHDGVVEHAGAHRGDRVGGHGSKCGCDDQPCRVLRAEMTAMGQSVSESDNHHVATECGRVQVQSMQKQHPSC
ncbi:unnamed protein product [Symbiodinium natans]|uniref:Uncharacterized protein n=1 Tax=Symbiodinium natans TaxID=878477 RepID=A0A812HUK7_9DINO|nr:unnamed protein product [Symbiodinium natans]